VDQFAEQDAIDDGDAVATEPIVDDDFGDNAEWMNVDLPQDCAVSVREKGLIQNMRRALRDIDRLWEELGEEDIDWHFPPTSESLETWSTETVE
jgi:hypothetical protein